MSLPLAWEGTVNSGLVHAGLLMGTGQRGDHFWGGWQGRGALTLGEEVGNGAGRWRGQHRAAWAWPQDSPRARKAKTHQHRPRRGATGPHEGAVLGWMM